MEAGPEKEALCTTIGTAGGLYISLALCRHSVRLSLCETSGGCDPACLPLSPATGWGLSAARQSSVWFIVHECIGAQLMRMFLLEYKKIIIKYSFILNQYTCVGPCPPLEVILFQSFPQQDPFVQPSLGLPVSVCVCTPSLHHSLLLLFSLSCCSVCTASRV